jgi:glycosyltransferase involved in cell wall biosynthesis
VKVLFVNTNPVWGGGENWHALSLPALKAAGFEVAAWVAPGSPLEFRLREAIADLEVYSGRFHNLSWLNPMSRRRAWSVLQHARPDVVLVSLPNDAKVVLGAARACGVPCRIYRRGIAVPVKNSFLNRHLFRVCATDVIVNSEDTRNQLLRHNKRLINPERIHLVYNGVVDDPRPLLLDHADRSLPLPLPVLNKGLRVFHAGRLTEQKGQKFLLRVCARLRDRREAFDCVIAGCGELEHELLELRSQLGLEQRVHFVGFQSDLVPWFDWADVVAMPSRFEGFGFVAVEAMLRGRPVVAADTSSLKEIVVDTLTGFRVPFGEEGGFADALVACGDPVRARLMGAAGLARAQACFGWGQAIDRLMFVMQQRVGKANP